MREALFVAKLSCCQLVTVLEQSEERGNLSHWFLDSHSKSKTSEEISCSSKTKRQEGREGERERERGRGIEE